MSLNVYEGSRLAYREVSGRNRHVPALTLHVALQNVPFSEKKQGHRTQGKAALCSSEVCVERLSLLSLLRWGFKQSAESLFMFLMKNTNEQCCQAFL